jgi:hypothetical protein
LLRPLRRLVRVRVTPFSAVNSRTPLTSASLPPRPGHAPSRAPFGPPAVAGREAVGERLAGVGSSAPLRPRPARAIGDASIPSRSGTRAHEPSITRRRRLAAGGTGGRQAGRQRRLVRQNLITKDSTSIYRSIDLSIYRSIDPSIYRSIDLSIYRSIDLSMYVADGDRRVPKSNHTLLHPDTLAIMQVDSASQYRRE